MTYCNFKFFGLGDRVKISGDGSSALMANGNVGMIIDFGQNMSGEFTAELLSMSNTRMGFFHLSYLEFDEV